MCASGMRIEKGINCPLHGLSNCDELKIVPAACITNNIPDVCRSEHHSHE
jgi:hypothetical protein